LKTLPTIEYPGRALRALALRFVQTNRSPAGGTSLHATRAWGSALRATYGWAAARLLSTANRYFVGVEKVGNSGVAEHGRLDALRRRATTGQVRIAHILFGYAVANRFFWVAPRKGDPTWPDVRNRVDWLARRDKAAAAHFVRVSLGRTSSPGVVIGLAHHLPSREAAREALVGLLADRSTLWRRIEDNGRLAGAFVGAARLLLPADTVESFVSWLVQSSDVLSADTFQAMDTVGYRFTARDDVASRTSSRDGARHRLVITESLDDPAAIGGLLPGAKSVTLLATSDTYGHADLERFKAPKGARVVVEHVRSRITRFSQEYIDLHNATADIGVRLAAQFFRTTDLVDPAYRQVIEVKLADFVFFNALRLRAIDLLFDVADIDHIVVATDNHGVTDKYVRLVAALDRIGVDPRVELVSLSRQTSSFRRFWELADVIARGSEIRADLHNARTPADVIRQKALADAESRAAALPMFRKGGRTPSVLLATANTPAYNRATAAYAGELAEAAEVRVVHFGPDVGNLVDLVAQQPGLRNPVTVLATPPKGDALLRRVVEESLLPALAGPPPGADATHAQRAAWAAAHADTERMGSTLASFVVQVQAINAWFDNMARERGLPDALVITPQRNLGVGAFAVAARLHGVPSIAVEPHAQDANYCRYLKVGADYYGVLSDYFRDQTAGQFGIDAERIRVLGSPRQVAPAGFDRASAHAAARADLKIENGRVLIGFFSQPSAWEGISAVWSAVLAAARSTGSAVLLKPHPEDSSSRIRQYLALADKDEVLVFNGDVTKAIDASDIVTTTYSIVGLDATLRRAPVVALADGDTDYPLDLASILGVPVVRSAPELARTIEAFKADSRPFIERTERFLAEEVQFVEGPGPRLRQFLDEVVRQGASGIRPDDQVPEHLFLDGPHPVFPV